MYEIEIEADHALRFLQTLPEKSQRIMREHIARLREDPFPGKGGDKEKLSVGGYDFYRMHVARSFTVFYQVYPGDHLVRVLKITTIELAHKRYRRIPLNKQGS